MAEIDLLQQQRDAIFNNFQTLRDQILQNPLQQQLQQQLQSQLAGNFPLIAQGTTAQLGANADAAAGFVSNQDDLTRQYFANAGLSGTGLEASQRLNTRRRASALTRQGRQEIVSKDTLNKVQARAATQQQVQASIEAQFRQLAQQVAQENAFRSQITAEGDPRNVAAVTQSGPGDPQNLQGPNPTAPLGSTGPDPQALAAQQQALQQAQRDLEIRRQQAITGAFRTGSVGRNPFGADAAALIQAAQAGQAFRRQQEEFRRQQTRSRHSPGPGQGIGFFSGGGF